ncbi:hypothetical protein RF11_13776 [Thelohanellus kitauei]|uniref:Uncharacterized protein n=1 Tax=Thelohanellus kitauei TaxID=669202 RepID=A0A0C2IV82_THEKT|nr:hypothetical protein RF11_13776 [Thelohanellus kitauei]
MKRSGIKYADEIIHKHEGLDSKEPITKRSIIHMKRYHRFRISLLDSQSFFGPNRGILYMLVIFVCIGSRIEPAQSVSDICIEAAKMLLRQEIKTLFYLKKSIEVDSIMMNDDDDDEKKICFD